MMSLHPVSLGIAFLGAVSYSICLNGRRALYQNLRYMLPVVILTALINPVFSHQGDDPAVSAVRQSADARIYSVWYSGCCNAGDSTVLVLILQ